LALKVNLANKQEALRILLLVSSAVVSVVLVVMISDRWSALQSPSGYSSQLQRVVPEKSHRWTWFGAPSGIPAMEIVEQNQQLQDLNINADLLGVLLAGDNSSATLKFRGQPERVFKLGDKLNGNLELLDIQAFRIVVSDKGVRKQLLMKKPDVILQTEGVADRVDNQAQSQGFALANMFGAVQMMADIRDGDVVLQVDGESVQDLMSNPLKMMAYRSSDSLPVTVMRNGSKETIYVNAASLSAKLGPTLGLKP
jgi:type II secretory pathway component PulC